MSSSSGQPGGVRASLAEAAKLLGAGLAVSAAVLVATWFLAFEAQGRSAGSLGSVLMFVIGTLVLCTFGLIVVGVVLMVHSLLSSSDGPTEPSRDELPDERSLLATENRAPDEPGIFKQWTEEPDIAEQREKLDVAKPAIGMAMSVCVWVVSIMIGFQNICGPGSEGGQMNPMFKFALFLFFGSMVCGVVCFVWYIIALIRNSDRE
jgi:hypothetical protein